MVDLGIIHALIFIPDLVLHLIGTLIAIPGLGDKIKQLKEKKKKLSKMSLNIFGEEKDSMDLEENGWNLWDHLHNHSELTYQDEEEKWLKSKIEESKELN